jgi:DNA-binding LacI/PurR family transcriptional regulator
MIPRMSRDVTEDRSRRHARIGLKAVARAVGVSPSTVSNAYNRPDQLSPAVRARVLEAAAELGYPGPDPIARSLRRGRAGALGVLFHESLQYAFDDPAAVRFLQGVSEISDAHGFVVVLVPAPSGSEPDGAAVQRAAVDGFLLHGLVGDHPLLTAALERRLPAVVVDGAPIPGHDFVGIDDAAAAEAAVRHLLELGHRRVGVLSLSPTAGMRGPLDPSTWSEAADSVNRRRLEGCARALDAFSLDFSGTSIQECGGSSIQAGRAGAHALLDRCPQTAIFAFSDALAIGAKIAAGERGLSIPADLSIVGFDGTAPAGERLTSIRQPQREKGRVAAERLVGALAPDPEPPERRLLRTELVRGATTGPPPG